MALTEQEQNCADKYTYSRREFAWFLALGSLITGVAIAGLSRGLWQLLVERDLAGLFWTLFLGPVAGYGARGIYLIWNLRRATPKESQRKMTQ